MNRRVTPIIAGSHGDGGIGRGGVIPDGKRVRKWGTRTNGEHPILSHFGNLAIPGQIEAENDHTGGAGLRLVRPTR